MYVFIIFNYLIKFKLYINVFKYDIMHLII